MAAQTWSIGTLFGPELVGGEDVMKTAHDRLEQVGWIQAIREPELMMEKAAWSSA